MYNSVIRERDCSRRLHQVFGVLLLR